MPQSPTLAITHVIQGQNQKEVTVNQAIDALESAIAGLGSFDASGVGDISLGDAGARPMFIEVIGTLTGLKTVIVPQRNKMYFFKNSTVGGFDLQVNSGIGTPLTLGLGFWTLVFCDGTECLELTRLISEHHRTLTASDAIDEFDKIVFCDTTSGSLTVTLPATIGIARKITVIKTVAANTVTIARNGNTINELAADPTITTDQQAIEVIGNLADNWLAYRKTLA